MFTWFFELLLTLVLGMLWSQGKCKRCINILSHCIVSHLQNPVQLRRAVDQSSQVHADQPEVVLVLDPGPGRQGSHCQLILYAASLSLSDHPGPFSNTVLWLKHTWQVATFSVRPPWSIFQHSLMTKTYMASCYGNRQILTSLPTDCSCIPTSLSSRPGPLSSTVIGLKCTRVPMATDGSWHHCQALLHFHQFWSWSDTSHRICDSWWKLHII